MRDEEGEDRDLLVVDLQWKLQGRWKIFRIGRERERERDVGLLLRRESAIGENALITKIVQRITRGIYGIPMSIIPSPRTTIKTTTLKGPTRSTF